MSRSNVKFFGCQCRKWTQYLNTLSICHNSAFCIFFSDTCPNVPWFFFFQIYDNSSSGKPTSLPMGMLPLLDVRFQFFKFFSVPKKSKKTLSYPILYALLTAIKDQNKQQRYTRKDSNIKTRIYNNNERSPKRPQFRQKTLRSLVSLDNVLLTFSLGRFTVMCSQRSRTSYACQDHG